MKAILVTPPTEEPIDLASALAHLRVDVPDDDDLIESMITAARQHVEDITRRALLTQTWEYFLPGWPACNHIKLPFGNLQSPLSLTIVDAVCVEVNGTYDLIFTGACTIPATGTYTVATNVITGVNLISSGQGYVAAPTVATQSGDGSVTAIMTVASVKWKESDGIETTLVVGTDYLVETNGEPCGRIVLPYATPWPSGTLYPSNPITIRFVCGWTTAALVPATIKAAIKLLIAKLYEGRGEDTVGQTVMEDKTVGRLLESWRLRDEF